MKMARTQLALCVLFTSLALVAWKTAPPTQSPDEGIESQHVVGPVHMLTGSGGNLGVSVGPDGVLLIDDKFANLAEEIQAALDTLATDANLQAGTPRFLINTHHHGDHTGGNPYFGKRSTIFAHANVRTRLIGEDPTRAMAPEGLPVVTYEDGLSIYFNGEEIQLVHLASGHTDGDTVVYFKGSNVVHMGDLGFIGLFPFIDTKGGGSVAGFLANLGQLLRTTDAKTRFIPGHGELASRADVQALRDMLQAVTERVQAALDAGKSAEDMKAEKLLAEFDSWNWSFITAEKLIDTVAGELGSK